MAKFLIAILLFSQAAIALAVCDRGRAAPAHAIAMEEHEVDGESCHEASNNTNLCLAHCQNEDQRADTSPLPVVFPLLAVPVLLVRQAPAETGVVMWERRRIALPVNGPPTRILFRSLQI